MLGFEKYLIDKGYKRYVYDRYYGYVESSQELSTMGKMFCHYSKDKRNWITFGIFYTPHLPILVSPLPRLEVKRKRGERIIIEDERYCGNVEVMLQNIPYDKILNAMYDKNIILKIDLT